MSSLPWEQIAFNLPATTSFILPTVSSNTTIKEVAEILSISESTSKSQYLRAKRLLRGVLKKKHKQSV